MEDWWREWLEDLAKLYRVSSLKMFKTAFPLDGLVNIKKYLKTVNIKYGLNLK